MTKRGTPRSVSKPDLKGPDLKRLFELTSRLRRVVLKLAEVSKSADLNPSSVEATSGFRKTDFTFRLSVGGASSEKA